MMADTMAAKDLGIVKLGSQLYLIKVFHKAFAVEETSKIFQVFSKVDGFS